MTTVYTRAAKGSALTWTEGDANITNLNNDKIEAVVDDTTPQLGGNLDVNGNSIVSTANGNITISPDGSGRIVLDGQNWPQSAPSTNVQYLEGSSNGDIAWTDRVNAKTIYETVKNDSGGSLSKGTPVYQIGISGNTITVGAARADDPAKLAIGVLDETIANEAEGRMLVLGEIKGVDTSGFTSGDKVYLGATGGYTNTAPTSTLVAVQFLGIVNRVDASNGSGYITGTLAEDKIRWNSSTSVYEAWNGTAWTAITEAPATLSGNVTDIDAVRSPNTITLSNYTGAVINDEIVFSGSDVTSAGLSTSTTYYIAAAIGGGAFEITDTFNGSPISITDVDPITNFTYVLTLSTDPGTSLNDLNDVNITGTPSDGNVLTYNAGSSQWQASAPAASGIASVSADTSPMLGGNLDVNSNNIFNNSGDFKVSISSLKYPSADGTNGQVLSTDGAGNIVFSTITSGITDVVSDTTPQLGGNLDVNGNSIVSTGSGNISLKVNNSTPQIVLEANNIIIEPNSGVTAVRSNLSFGVLNSDATLTTRGTGDLILNTNSGTSSGSIRIYDGSNGNIVVEPNGTGMTQLNNIEYHEKIYSLGTTSGTITPDVVNGNVQTITLNGNLTFSEFSNPVAGQSLTLIVNTGGTSRTLTSTMKFAGGSKTLSTTNTTDIISVFYDGTNYWASLAKDFK